MDSPTETDKVAKTFFAVAGIALVLVTLLSLVPSLRSDATEADQDVDHIIDSPVDFNNLSWSRGADMPYATSDLGIATHKNWLFAIGGNTVGDVDAASSTDLLLDLEHDAWKIGSPLPIELDRPRVVVIDGMVYTVGGYNINGSVNGNVYMLDQYQVWWAITQMPAPAADSVVVVLDKKIHIIGGHNPSGDTSRHDIYDPVAKTWSVGAPIPKARSGAAGAVVDGKIYVTGGKPGTDTEVYEPSKDVWMKVADLPAARSSFSGIDFGGRFAVFGGQDTKGKVAADVFAYNIRENKWTKLPSLPTPVAGAGIAEFHGRAYVIGGSPTGSDKQQINMVQVLAGPAD